MTVDRLSILDSEDMKRVSRDLASAIIRALFLSLGRDVVQANEAFWRSRFKETAPYLMTDLDQWLSVGDAANSDSPAQPVLAKHSKTVKEVRAALSD